MNNIESILNGINGIINRKKLIEQIIKILKDMDSDDFVIVAVPKKALKSV